MEKIKIMYVIDNLAFGGGEMAFSQIVNGLNRKRYEPFFACSEGGALMEKFEGSGVKFFPVNFKKRVCFRTLRRLREIFCSEKPCIIHSQGSRANFYTRLAAGRTKISKLVCTIAMPVEGYDVGFFKKAVYVALDRFTERYVDRFIVVSESLRKKLVEKHHISSEKIVKISNGVETDLFQPGGTDAKKKIAREFKLPEKAVLVGSIGRIVWQKGMKYLIQAIKEMDEKQGIRDVRCLIVGEGELRSILEKEARDLGLEGRVVFTGFRQDIRDILSALDIFVMPSIREGQPIVLLEAMSMAKPIVCTDIEGINETVDDGSTGILVPPKDPAALSGAVISLLKDRAKADKMAEQAREVAGRNFDIRDKIRQHEELYERLIAERSGDH